jgi:hypothetical protein
VRTSALRNLRSHAARNLFDLCGNDGARKLLEILEQIIGQRRFVNLGGPIQEHQFI